MKEKPHRRITGKLIAGAAVILLATLPATAGTAGARGPNAEGSSNSRLSELAARAAAIWGADNVWLPGPTRLVEYEPDLGERSTVDFENGLARVQIVLRADDDPRRAAVLAHLRQGVGNLVQGKATDPAEMLAAPSLPAANDHSRACLPDSREIRVYLVRRGDSLWKIARRFGMKTADLAELNGLEGAETLHVGQPLKVLVFSAHVLTLDASPSPPAGDPLLLDQIRMVNGRPVPPWLVREFAAEVVGDRPQEVERVRGEDGVERLAVTVKFKLVADHLEVRARKFHPLVQRHAEKNALDPAVIMAIIHTESVFNPRARSSTPAYGLMQLTPYGGAREAYRKLYGKKRTLTAKYLYDPQNNITLGTTYLNILKSRYMGEILDPASRTYCAVGAYNAGAANVGRAFIPQKSINRATPAINRLNPKEVYSRLVSALPFQESRNYVRKVFKRVRIYRKWQ